MVSPYFLAPPAGLSDDGMGAFMQQLQAKRAQDEAAQRSNLKANNKNADKKLDMSMFMPKQPQGSNPALWQQFGPMPGWNTAPLAQGGGTSFAGAFPLTGMGGLASGTSGFSLAP